MPISNTITEYDNEEIGFKVFKCKQLTTVNMSVEQQNDSKIYKIITDIQNGKLNNDSYVIDINDNILYKTQDLESKKYYAIYLLEKFQKSIIEEYHSSPFSGHFGIKNTYDKIRKKYFWPEMLTQITEYVKNCHNCQINKINRKLKHVYCDLLEVENPFSRVEIDITGPYQETIRGNKYVIAAIDCFTKFVEMRAIPNQDKFTVAKFIYEDILTRHSPPLILQSDRGGAFLSEIVSEIIVIFPPTVQKFSTGYNPSVQGQIERANASIKEYLRTNIIDEEDWDLMIPSCRFSINTKLNTTTNRTPFELLYNRQPYTFKDLELNFRTKTDRKGNLFTKETKEKYEKEINNIRRKIRERQIKNAKYYNKTHRQPIYLIGDLVMVRNKHLELNKPKALQPKFEGPFIVIMKCGKNAYLLQEVVNPDKHRKVNKRLMESYYNSNYRFLENNPLPDKYVADINTLNTEFDADSELSSDSETEVYLNSEEQIFENNLSRNDEREIPLNSISSSSDYDLETEIDENQIRGKK